MSSTAAPAQPSTSTSDSTPVAAPAKTPLPTLLALEDDDEFEEFPSEDWDVKETYGASLTKATTGDKKSAGLDSLWDDNWDDDDVADDFSVQLRGELEKQNQMQT